jgi:O-methyltransferase
MSSTLLESIQLSIHQGIARLHYGLANYRHPLRQIARQHAASASRIKGGTTPLELIELHNAVTAWEKIPGDLAEAGVYKGTTAALMLSASHDKKIHLFDTFEGLPDSENQFKMGGWAGSLGEVRRNLDAWSDRTVFHSGFFPASATGLEGSRFSFVHLDMDLYQSTIDALHWFWPRLNAGGALMSHDYPQSAGVVQAFHEFFDSTPVPIFPLSGQQCMAIKTTH